jgi:predicted sulfurtransferase
MEERMHSKFIIKAALAAGVYAIAMPCYCAITQLSPEKFNSMLSATSDKLTIVDVRSGYDYQKSHITGALNVPYNATTAQC